MATISLCMIVKNEEDNLAACLNSVHGIADQIVIVDTGSDDGTKKIASAFGAEVYDFEWISDFSAARNYSFSKAIMDYVLWMDADDVILPADRERLLTYKHEISPDTDVVYFTYNTGFNLDGEVSFSFRRERLLKRSMGFRWQDPVHEFLRVWGTLVVRADIAISHMKNHNAPYSRRNLEIYEKQLENGVELSPRGQFYYARELKNHSENQRAIAVFSDYLKKGLGWTEDCINACLDLALLHENEDYQKALTWLFRSFVYDLPRSEVCCNVGRIYVNHNDLKKAAYWYELAAVLEIPDTSGFVQLDYYSYIPNIQLCLIYDRMGEREKAIEHHEKAKAQQPNNPSVLHNEAYFYGNKV